VSAHLLVEHGIEPADVGLHLGEPAPEAQELHPAALPPVGAELGHAAGDDAVG
jgi:hypothetical protein